MDNNTIKLLPLFAMARRLHVPNNWLRAEAEAGRIPHLKANNQILFNPDIVERLLVERASKEGNDDRRVVLQRTGNGRRKRWMYEQRKI